MRAIKFRGWHIVEEKLLPVELIDFSNNLVSLNEGDNSLSDTLEMVKLMQYTGLKDNNDNEIYEGDIVEGGYLNPLTNKFVSRKYLIEYRNGGFSGKLIGSSPYGDTLLRFINGEVIGNIFKNPELVSS